MVSGRDGDGGRHVGRGAQPARSTPAMASTSAGDRSIGRRVAAPAARSTSATTATPRDGASSPASGGTMRWVTRRGQGRRRRVLRDQLHRVDALGGHGTPPASGRARGQPRCRRAAPGGSRWPITVAKTSVREPVALHRQGQLRSGPDPLVHVDRARCRRPGRPGAGVGRRTCSPGATTGVCATSSISGPAARATSSIARRRVPPARGAKAVGERPAATPRRRARRAHYEASPRARRSTASPSGWRRKPSRS